MESTEYNALDDVPHSVRRNLQSIQSPVPSHYSRVSNSPSPGQQQVMSPSGSLQLQQSRKQCRQTTPKRLRSVTQLDILREVLLLPVGGQMGRP